MQRLVTIALASWMTAAAGCGSEELVVGEVRCHGEGIDCTPGIVQELFVSAESPARVATLPELSVVWNRRYTNGISFRSRDSVLQRDGTLTILAERNLGDERGAVIVRFDAEGNELSRDDSLVRSFAPPDGGSLPFQSYGSAIALGGDGFAYVAEGWGAQDGGGHAELTLYRVGDDGEPEELFRDPRAGLPGGLARGPDGDFFIATASAADPPEALGPEVTRYTAAGEVRYRQSGLLQPFVAGSLGGAPERMLDLTVDPLGNVFVLAQGQGPGELGLASLAVDGNLRWYVDLGLRAEASVLLGPGSQPYAMGHSGATGSVASIDGYAVFRLDRDQPSTPESRLILSERLLSTPNFAFTMDHGGRVLVRSEPEVDGERVIGIERYAANFGELEVLPWPSEIGPAPQRIHVLPDGDLIHHGGNNVGRVTGL